MKFQVHSTDEYGQSFIIATKSSLSEAESVIDELVTDANFNNALTSDDQLRSIEAFYVEIEDGVYAGNISDGHPRMLVRQGQSYTQQKLGDRSVRILIGSRNGEKVYLKTDKGQDISSLSHGDLEGKTQYFIRVI